MDWLQVMHPEPKMLQQHINVYIHAQYKENAIYNYWNEKLSGLYINKEQAYNNTGNSNQNWTCDSSNSHCTSTYVWQTLGVVLILQHMRVVYLCYLKLLVFLWMFFHTNIIRSFLFFTLRGSLVFCPITSLKWGCCCSFTIVDRCL